MRNCPWLGVHFSHTSERMYKT